MVLLPYLIKVDQRFYQVKQIGFDYLEEGTLFHPHREMDGEREMRLKAIMNPEGNGLFE